MAAGMNSWNFTGNLTRDPELRSTGSGTQVCSLSVAVNGWKADDVQYVDVSVWGKSAEACATYLVKGAKVGVSGRCRVRTWQGKDDGVERWALACDAQDVTFLSSKADNPTSGAPAQTPATKPAAQPVAQAATPAAANDDIPF